jgi:hypothetical protein
MIRFSDTDSDSCFMPVFDVPMLTAICLTKSMQNLMIRLIQLYIPFIETFSSPLVLQRNCNKFQITNHAPPKCNFPHILYGTFTDFDFLCIQQAMLNTDCDNVLLAKHHFLWANVAYLSCVQQYFRTKTCTHIQCEHKIFCAQSTLNTWNWSIKPLQSNVLWCRTVQVCCNMCEKKCNRQTGGAG